jgi:hypothetical protein
LFNSGNKLDVKALLNQVARMRSEGHGLKYQDWHLELPDAHHVDGLVETIVSWCKVTLSNSRRPYGIDLFDLIVAYRAHEDSQTQTFRLERLRPMELYQEPLPQTLLDRLTQSLARQPSRLYVSAAFFSWGDAAHLALPGDQHRR